MATEHLGKTIIFLGLILVVVGVALTVFGRIPLLGKLPGDFHVRRGNFQFYFPIATSIALSILLTVLFWLFSRVGRR